MTRHLGLFREHLIEQITNESFQGLGIIDFESWRPIFRQNWGSLAPYRDRSVQIVRQRYPFWDNKSQEREAVEAFEKWGRIFMEETLKTAKALRPNATWGYYAYPYCYNLTPQQQSSQCSSQVLAENDKYVIFVSKFLFLFEEGVSLHFQPKVRFRGYFVYLLMRQNSKKKSTIRKVLRTLILHINNFPKLITN